MNSRRVATFAKEVKWIPGADSTMRIGDWQAWVDGEGHWKVRGPNPDNEAHNADGDIELTETEYIGAGNSEARRKIRARRAKEAARAYIKKMTHNLHSLWAPPSKRHHAMRILFDACVIAQLDSYKKIPAQLQREIDEVLLASEAMKYGLMHEEALSFVKHPRYLSIRSEVERWREQHGVPATNSSLTRNYLLDKVRAR